MAAGAFEVEPENFDAQVVYILTRLLSHVEFGAYIEEIATSVTSNAHWKHHPHTVLLIFRPLNFLQFGWIEIWWVVFYENFSFCHLK